MWAALIVLCHQPELTVRIAHLKASHTLTESISLTVFSSRSSMFVHHTGMYYLLHGFPPVLSHGFLIYIHSTSGHPTQLCMLLPRRPSARRMHLQIMMLFQFLLVILLPSCLLRHRAGSHIPNSISELCEWGTSIPILTCFNFSYSYPMLLVLS